MRTASAHPYRKAGGYMVECALRDAGYLLGYDSRCHLLRTWSARSPKTIDFASFNRGEYVRRWAEGVAEVISKCCTRWTITPPARN
jgi:hypothetical protein